MTVFFTTLVPWIDRSIQLLSWPAAIILSTFAQYWNYLIDVNYKNLCDFYFICYSALRDTSSLLLLAVWYILSISYRDASQVTTQLLYPDVIRLNKVSPTSILWFHNYLAIRIYKNYSTLSQRSCKTETYVQRCTIITHKKITLPVSSKLKQRDSWERWFTRIVIARRGENYRWLSKLQSYYKISWNPSQTSSALIRPSQIHVIVTQNCILSVWWMNGS